EAAMAAGLNVLRLIHEPSAALLAYGIGQDSPSGKSNVLVYKLGGTSLSITVIEVNSGLYRVLSTNTDDSIGGIYFTEALAQHLASEFQSSQFPVVLCGGSGRIPKLQQLIKELFPAVELLNSIPPDEVIPIGAAIEAGILLGRENTFLDDEMLSIECSAKDILMKIVLQDLDVKEGGLHDILTVLTMKRDGSLHVTCTDQDTGKCEAITVEVAS
ncbi:hypothetical protein JD844_027504, partial [Phrynosoma platyrhinos]